MESSRSVTLHAQALLTPEQLLTPGWLTIEDSLITAVGEGHPPRGGSVVRLGGHLLVPGFVDLHVHGGGGASVNGAPSADSSADAVEASVRRLAAHAVRHGTTALLATAMAGPPDELLGVVRGIQAIMRGPLGAGTGARVLGANLEGPWLSPARAGAHDICHLRAPDLDELGRLVAAAPGVVRIVTVAPELAGATHLIHRLVAEGIVAAIGHTDAEYATTVAAIDAGATHVTHLFNAMAGLHHRDPGPVAAGLNDERVTVEVIADGIHVHPAVLGLVVRAAPGRLVAITDAVTATSAVHVDGARVTVVGAPDTLAGSLLTMDAAIANLVRAGASVRAAVAAATMTPARVIGETSVGSIAVGRPADLAILDPDLGCSATVIAGRCVHDPDDVLHGALPRVAG